MTKTTHIESSRRSGAQVVVDALIEAGVKTVFGYPGGTIMPVFDTLLSSPIDHILTRHEQGAIHAADGYARSTGEMGVCIATSGPGATNLTTGISTAMLDSSPVLCLTGQVATQLIGTDAFQEADIYGLANSGVTKQAFLPRSVDELPEVMAEAVYVANSGRKGPVLVDLPKDVLVNVTQKSCPGIDEVPGYHPYPDFSEAAIREAHALLRSAQQPVCIIGGGCKWSNATEAFRAWCNKTGVPVVTTLNGIGAPDPAYPGLLGMVGMHGLRRANHAIDQCDLLLAFGMRFDDRVTCKISAFASNAKIVHIDLDKAEVGKLVGVDIAINGDLRKALEFWNGLIDHESVVSPTEWNDKVMDLGEGLQSATHPGEGMRAIEAVEEIFKRTTPRTALVTDVGQNQMWAAQRFYPDGPERFVTSGGAGTMGFGMPAAIGAAMARPGEKVVSISGDGGFQMTMAEMATVRRLDLPIKIAVLDNSFLGMVRQWQELFFDRRYSGVDLSDNPDFAALARVYGIEGFTVEESDTLSETIDAWWNAEGPALVHCICRREDNVFPMVPAGASLAEMLESE